MHGVRRIWEHMGAMNAGGKRWLRCGIPSGDRRGGMERGPAPCLVWANRSQGRQAGQVWREVWIGRGGGNGVREG
jgi:hypothetical protein